MQFTRLIKKDLLKRKKIKISESKRVLLKYLLNSNLGDKFLLIRLYHHFFNRSFKNQISFISAKNRCLVTGRGKAVFSSYRLSRHEFRKQALRGFLPGVVKGSW